MLTQIRDIPVRKKPQVILIGRRSVLLKFKPNLAIKVGRMGLTRYINANGMKKLSKTMYVKR